MVAPIGAAQVIQAEAYQYSFVPLVGVGKMMATRRGIDKSGVHAREETK